MKYNPQIQDRDYLWKIEETEKGCSGSFNWFGNILVLLKQDKIELSVSLLH